MTEAVLADAQFGVARVLKPFPGFEAKYQGQSADEPIILPGALSPQAGKPGYSPHLMGGHPVPMGSKVMLWLPTILSPSGLALAYSFSIVWRLRNIRDFQTQRAAYHFPKQSLGIDGKYVIPAAKKVVLYESGTAFDTESATYRNRSIASLESLQVRANLQKSGFAPDGSPAVLQQGLGGAAETTATFVGIQMDSEGDEMLILVTARSGTDTVRTWDFSPGGVDFPFSEFFGNGGGQPYPDLGVYVFTGSNP